MTLVYGIKILLILCLWTAEICNSCLWISAFKNLIKTLKFNNWPMAWVGGVANGNLFENTHYVFYFCPFLRLSVIWSVSDQGLLGNTSHMTNSSMSVSYLIFWPLISCGVCFRPSSPSSIWRRTWTPAVRWTCRPSEEEPKWSGVWRHHPSESAWLVNVIKWLVQLQLVWL